MCSLYFFFLYLYTIMPYSLSMISLWYRYIFVEIWNEWQQHETIAQLAEKSEYGMPFDKWLLIKCIGFIIIFYFLPFFHELFQLSSRTSFNSYSFFFLQCDTKHNSLLLHRITKNHLIQKLQNIYFSKKALEQKHYNAFIQCKHWIVESARKNNNNKFKHFDSVYAKKQKKTKATNEIPFGVVGVVIITK